VKKLVVESPAKVNLSLEVLGRRADGYHSLRGIMVPVTLEDVVTFTPGGRGFVFHAGQGTPRGEGNLAHRAATLLMERTGVRHALDLRVLKRIPVAAGLGGGSSDAAAVLAGLNRMWDLGLSGADLESLGLELGSDVPFFLRGGICVAEGRGEELERLSVPVVPEFVLVHPPIRVSAGWAFDHIPEEHPRATGATNMLRVALATGRPELLGPHLVNDLQPGVEAEHPIVREIRERLLSAGALGAVMSGSGPTVLGVSADAESANRVAAEMEDSRWRVYRASVASSQVEETTSP
jgi:4-diphosphocytidyl-2-C-methyl-D-erythritol kinase